MPSVLIVESDDAIAEMLANVIRDEINLPVIFTGKGQDALKVTQYMQPLLCIINERLKDGNGFALSTCLRQRRHLHHVPVVLLSTCSVPYRGEEVAGANVAWLEIPADINEFVEAIKKALVVNH